MGLGFPFLTENSKQNKKKIQFKYQIFQKFPEDQKSQGHHLFLQFDVNFQHWMPIGLRTDR